MGRTVLLLLDLQQGIFDRLQIKPEYLQQAVKARHASRTVGFQIIYVTTSFRNGHPEVYSRNKTTASIRSRGGFVEGGRDVAIPAAIAPAESEDIVVNKRRVSAFTDSDLDVVLRSLEADTLVLAGIATSGAVLSTLRQAVDLDYRGPPHGARGSLRRSRSRSPPRPCRQGLSTTGRRDLV